MLKFASKDILFVAARTNKAKDYAISKKQNIKITSYFFSSENYRIRNAVFFFFSCILPIFFSSLFSIDYENAYIYLHEPLS